MPNANFSIEFRFTPGNRKYENTTVESIIQTVTDLMAFVNSNFANRLPTNAKLTWKIWDQNYGLTKTESLLKQNNDITVSIPREFLKDPSGLLYDCIDHEIVHVNDIASGRAAKWYLAYGMESMNAIMDYRAYSRNQDYSNNHRNGRYDYSTTINTYKNLLPLGYH